MNAESVKRFEVTYIEDIQGGETAEHVISASSVEIVDGNLCFYDGAIGGGFFKKRKLVAAYAAGVWVTFMEYEDEAQDEAEWLPQEDLEWEESSREAAEKAPLAFRDINPGKDGSVGG